MSGIYEYQNFEFEPNEDGKIGFVEVAVACAGHRKFVENFNRLTGCNLGKSLNRNALEMAIDKATGYSGESKDDMGKFVAFVWEFVWRRLPEDAFEATAN